MDNLFRVSLDSDKAELPNRQNEGDAGYDLVATDIKFDDKNGVYIYNTDVHIEIPKGHVGLIAPRSSIYKRGLILANNMGVIDRGYRGEIKVLFVPIHKSYFERPIGRMGLTDGRKLAERHRGGIGHTPYEIGERIAQLLLVPVSTPQPVESESLSESERGERGFGSTGRK